MLKRKFHGAHLEVSTDRRMDRISGVRFSRGIAMRVPFG
jgi:hypothetical protein